jgi:hypothetical protein
VLVHCGLYDLLRESIKSETDSSSFGESFNCSKLVRLNHVQQQLLLSSPLLSSPLLSSPLLFRCMYVDF